MNASTGLGIFLLGAAVGALVTRIAAIGQMRRFKEEIVRSVKAGYGQAA
jgi:uncharacterized integral membrane protein